MRGTWRINQFFLLICLVAGWVGVIPAQAAGLQDRVVVELVYYQPNAAEVELVWGVDGWQLLPEQERPSHTKLENNVMWTRMTPEVDRFVATLALPPGTRLDYGFQTTQRVDGTAVSIWEADGDNDFHLVANTDAQVVHYAAFSLFSGSVFHVSSETEWVKQEIVYENPSAGEVTLVWGLDSWKRLPEAQLPVNTTVDDGVMHTPLFGNGRNFSAELLVPAGQTLDYGFLVARKRTGEPITAWEADGENDFHTAVAENNPVFHQSTLDLATFPTAQRPFKPGWGWVSGLLLVFVLACLSGWRFPFTDKGSFQETAVWMWSVTLVLFLFLLIIRANLVGVHWLSWQISWVLLPTLLAASAQDFLFATAVAALFLLLAWLVRNRRSGLRWLRTLFALLTTLSLLLAIANIQVFYLLGQPASVQLFYYADFLNSVDSQANLADNLPPTVLLTLLLACLALWAVGRCVAGACQRWLLPERWPILPGVLAVALLPGAVFGGLVGWPQIQLVNPVVALAESVFEARQRTVLSRLAYPQEFDEQFTAVAPSGPPPFVREVPLRNVIVVVLESVGASSVSSYGGIADVTPQLTHLREAAIQFDNIYAHAPASNKSLVSLLGGIYPWISYRSITQEQPALPLPTLSSALQENGYRTAFFSTADWRFQQSRTFLAARQFDLVQDMQTLPCDQPVFVEEEADEPYTGGLNDGCLLEALEGWVAQDGERPFFAMLWTVETHYPYFLAENEIDFGVSDPAYNRYLNGLHHSDAEIGRLVDWLAESGQLEETLLVVTGDHGEAFGQHGQTGHALGIYEENVHVPLLLINPALFSGETAVTVGGHVDIAPTILHLLELPAPQTWQGSSLLAPTRSNRTYFFSPWADTLFGFREGAQKMILNASTNEVAVFNLAEDPGELTNLAMQEEPLIQYGEQRMAAWVQVHGRFMDALFAQEIAQ